MKYIIKTLSAGLLITSGIVSTNSNAGAKLDDATILAIFDQTNTADLWAGRLAVKKGMSEDVQMLGKMVAVDHVAVQQMGRDLATKLGIIPTPPDNDTSAENLAKTVAMLQSKSGSEFDRAYLQHEVVFHQSVVDAIKKTLLPAIQNEQLRELVNKVLPGFEQHLAETKAAAKKFGIEK
ncbi:MAG: DUF4142 domain-containing protein [Gammaproteobacteria bacterium]|nr:DUF4142 domain-containing protein [Gammaproteobacteria bacterium]